MRTWNYRIENQVNDLLERYGDLNTARTAVKQIIYFEERPHRKEFWEDVYDYLNEEQGL